MRISRSLGPVLALTLALSLSSTGAPPQALASDAGAAADSILYATRTANANLLGVLLTNYGFLGNNFVSRSLSFEYPLGSSYEHLPRGGLWVGAEATNESGAFIGVTTACLDGSVGTSPASGTEFTPAGTELTVRSSLPGSPYYDPEAISEQDINCYFSDNPAKSFSPENHAPLNILVHQRTLAWSNPNLAHVVFLRYVVRNQGYPLQNAHVGLYTEFASGNRDDYCTWPPSSACSSTGHWFQKAWIQYDDSLRLFREHYCYNGTSPFPNYCNLGHVPAWVGFRLLGVSPGSLADAGKHVTLAAWTYSPGDAARDQDVERYALMSAGTIQDLSAADLMPTTGDPIELLAVGPFDVIDPGDSVTVDFALVGGTEIADIQEHSRAAQRVYDAGFDYVVPVQISLASAEAEPGLVRLRWYVAEGAGTSWIVARSQDGEAWSPVGETAPDGTGYALFEDRSVSGGERYGYRLESSDGGIFGEAWVEVPRGSAFALLGAQPDPAGPEGLRVAFSLAQAGPVTIEVFDLSGRRMLANDLGVLGPGNHLVNLGRPAPMAPGTFFIRLSQGDQVRTRRAVLLE